MHITDAHLSLAVRSPVAPVDSEIHYRSINHLLGALSCYCTNIPISSLAELIKNKLLTDLNINFVTHLSLIYSIGEA